MGHITLNNINPSRLELNHGHPRPMLGIMMKRYGLVIIILILLVVVACTLPGRFFTASASLSGRNAYLLVAPPGSSPTPTPFQPIPPTPTYLPTAQVPEATPTAIPSTAVPEAQFTTDEGRSWEDYPGPSVWPDIDVPAPLGILSHPEGQVNILLLGSDQRPNDGGFRTDTIQLLTINPQEGTVKLTAFPRDLYVYIPGYTVQRINTAMGWGGFEALAETMEYNFGVKPKYYVLINFGSFKDVIDSLGGITVHIGRDLCDQRDAFGWYCVSEGTMWMDGESALWYVRSRYTTSDLDRGRRQQEVLEAVFDKLINLNALQRAPELFQIYLDNVTTNLDFDVLSSLLPIAYHLAESRDIIRNSIGEGQVYSWTNTYGAMVLVPMQEQVLEIMRQVISEP
jgi:LCP family protein required for cell wall assembly